MHTFAKLFGLCCGVLVIAIAARYGFKTSDNDVDGAIWAFTFGAVTLGGLFGHAFGVRAWRHSKLLGALVFAGSAFALIISLSNSIGAMAGRGNEQQAERIRVADIVRDARRSLKRAEDEREGLTFTPADETAVQAAKAKAGAAAQAKEAECTYRGPRCRNKETAESEALAGLEAVTRNKALTDRAAKLDAGIVALREKIEKAGPVLEANAQGSALARLFDMPDTKAATLSTYQNLAMATVIEFLIVISLVASEVIEQHERRQAPAALSPKAAARKEAESEEQDGAEAAPLIEALPAGTRPKPFPAASKPRLIASQPNPAGSVAQVMADILAPGRGRVEIVALYAAYSKACAANGKRPVAAGEFPAALAALCNKLNIKIEATDTGVYLLKVKLLTVAASARA
jgi:hypothetical protein